MVSEWAHRFYDNIDPPSDKRGFDHILSGTRNTIKKGNEALNLGDRMVELKERISSHAGILATLPLPPACLAWNKNPQCPPKTWDDRDGLLSKEGPVIYKECKADSHKRICVKWYNTETYTFVFCFCEDPKPKDWGPGDEDPNRCRAWESTGNQKSLILPRHNPYEKSLEIVDYVSSYFPPRWPDAIIAYEGNTKQEPGRNYGFWLIDEKDADFVYAILKSSMFRSWCELTAADEGEEEGHFSTGMWDTFPIQDTTTLLSKLSNRYVANIFSCLGGGATVEGAISCAGRWLSRNVWKQHSPTFSFDECMDELCGFGPVPSSPYSRKQILAKGFLDMFPSLRNDVVSLA